MIAKSDRAKNIVLFFCALGALICVLLRPDIAAQGVLRGLSLCYKSIIPALFPFLVLMRLVLTGSAARYLGLPLLPYTRLLGLRSKKAATALLLGLAGGFCGGAKAVQTLYEQEELSAAQAALLLCPCTNSGFGFVVSGVGAAMLHSAPTGWLLFCALSLASLFSGLLYHAAVALHCRKQPLRFTKQAGCSVRDARETVGGSASEKLISAVQDAVTTTLMLCGFVIAFSFLTAILSPTTAAPLVLYGIALPLEVTSACAAAAQSDSAYRAFLCCAAISCAGLSVFAQVRALVDPAISLMPLVLSRLLHLPLSLLIFWILLKCFPGVLAVSASYPPAIQMPSGALFAVFLLCATFFCVFPVRKTTE